MSEKDELAEKIRRGEFRFGDTIYLQLLMKKDALEEAKQITKQRLDVVSLYTYIVSLEKRVEALEVLVEVLRRLIT